MYAARRGFSFRDVCVNKEVVDCGPGEDTACYDRGVDEVEYNYETTIEGSRTWEAKPPAAREPRTDPGWVPNPSSRITACRITTEG
jgi:hypothetical protein